MLKLLKWPHCLYSSQFLQLYIIAQQRLTLEVPHKEVYTAPLTEKLFWTLLRCNCCLIASTCGSSMLEGPWAVPFEIFKIAFHARHVCLIDIALFLPLSLQALCRFLGNVPYPPTKCHTISSKSSRKPSECQNEKDSEKLWDRHVRLSGIERKLNYWSTATAQITGLKSYVRKLCHNCWWNYNWLIEWQEHITNPDVKGSRQGKINFMPNGEKGQYGGLCEQATG